MPTIKCAEYKITEKKSLSADVFSYEIACPDIAEIAAAGQFVHIKINGFTLRRPISICDIDKDSGTITVVFEIRGKGTAELAKLNAGDLIDIIAPLGNGFSLPENPSGKMILVGGGIGVPPLFNAAKRYKKQATAILGFRSYEQIILTDDFKNFGVNVVICTEDGSVGHKGFITEPLSIELSKGDVERVYACGPAPMLKAVIDLCKNNGVKCEVSLEQRMGCGVGACAVCSCKISSGGETEYQRVCKDGPVFDGEKVVI